MQGFFLTSYLFQVRMCTAAQVWSHSTPGRSQFSPSAMGLPGAFTLPTGPSHQPTRRILYTTFVSMHYMPRTTLSMHYSMHFFKNRVLCSPSCLPIYLFLKKGRFMTKKISSKIVTYISTINTTKETGYIPLEKITHLTRGCLAMW